MNKHKGWIVMQPFMYVCGARAAATNSCSQHQGPVWFFFFFFLNQILVILLFIILSCW